MNNYIINSCGVSECEEHWMWTTQDTGNKDYDIWAVFSGEGNIKIGYDSYDVKEGCCFILPPYEKIIATHNPKFPLYVVNVHFMPKEDNHVLHTKLHQMRNMVFFRELLDRIILFHYKGEDEKSEMYLKCALEELDDYQFDLMYNRNVKNDIYKICERINSQNENVSLSSLAKEYGYSSSYLGKLFKKTMKIDFSSYVINARINRAKILLKTSNYPVSVISEKLGFYDTCYFIKQFTKITGVTPGKYKNS